MSQERLSDRKIQETFRLKWSVFLASEPQPPTTRYSIVPS